MWQLENERDYDVHREMEIETWDVDERAII